MEATAKLPPKQEDERATHKIYFSIIIPLHNKEQHIARAVNSVLNQSHRLYEIIVVDDGSTDNGLHILKNTTSKVKIISQKNMGASVARNTGIKHAKHSYITFLDADDEWLPQHLANIQEMITKKPKLKAYGTNYYKKTGKTVKQAITKNLKRISIQDYFDIARTGSTPLSSSSTCLHRSLFDRFGGFPKNVRLYEDLYLWTKICIHERVCFHSQPSAIYHRDANNRTCNNLIRSIPNTPFDEIIREAEENGDLSGQRLKHAKQFLCHYKLLNTFKALTNNQKGNALKILKSTIPKTKHQATKKIIYYLACHLPSELLHKAWKATRRH